MKQKSKSISYIVKNENVHLSSYSGSFDSKEKALLWYESHGKWLEKEFNRELVLCS